MMSMMVVRQMVHVMFKIEALSSPITEEEGLKHAILQSLLNFDQAKVNDGVSKEENYQGWWASNMTQYAGSRDWTLARSKMTKDTQKRAKRFTEKALEWLIDGGYAKSIDVLIEVDRNRLNRLITITKPNDKKVEFKL